MDKLHIVITGCRNTGKSSLLNAMIGQETAIVSDTPGTTTDPVKKNYELPGFAAITFTDTAGIDDVGSLGQKRIEKTLQSITQADLALLVITDNRLTETEKLLIGQFTSQKKPFIIVHNKSDRNRLTPELKDSLEKDYHVPVIDVSATMNEHIDQLIGLLKTVIKPASRSLIGDLIQRGDIVMLVTPIDSEAPTGRLILPQVQMIRDILDNQCISIVLQPEEIPPFLQRTGIQPHLVITDSQVFKKVAELIPAAIPLTSFSIILARHKGNFEHYLAGTGHIDKLTDGDRVLMLESCSHHVSCEDIGRFKLPALFRKYTGKKLEFDFIAGFDQIQQPLENYAMVVQCGGCMVTATQLQNRLKPIIEKGIPISNYGMAIAYLNGIFTRAVEIFSPDK